MTYALAERLDDGGNDDWDLWMFREVSEKAADPVEKRLYDRLSDWEKAHAEFVGNFYDYFEDKGLYMNE